MQETNDKTIQEIERLALAGMGPKTVDGGNIPYVLVPSGYEAKAMPGLIFNDHTKAPERVKQAVTVMDPLSFIEYYRLFSDENSRVFADETKLSVVAVLDYHGAKEGAPRWGQHRLSLALQKSEEWKVWIAHNNKKLTQVEFVEFLEQNSIDITTPTPAAMMDLASDLSGKTEVEFGSGIKQANGQVQFRYTEITTTNKTSGGAVDVPDRFTISIPTFVGGERIQMEALMRFRVNGGKLTFWFTLVRHEAVIRQAFDAATSQISKELGIVIINGQVGS